MAKTDVIVDDFEGLTQLGRSGVSEPSMYLEKFPCPPDMKHVVMTSDEVTACCPVTTQPDQYIVSVDYLPEKFCIESKSMKLYLQSFRNRGVFCERLASDIASHVVDSIDPYSVKVKVIQKPRGGIKIEAEAERSRVKKEIQRTRLHPRSIDIDVNEGENGEVEPLERDETGFIVVEKKIDEVIEEQNGEETADKKKISYEDWMPSENSKKKPNLLMLDSGAFGVWNKGRKVDFEGYIDFCEKTPEIDYFVSLDVIPGKPNNPKSLTPAAIEEACEQGWKNYKKMIETLPREKVIPVFHQGDSFKWLDRYLDSRVPYLGISPANDRTTEQRAVWLDDVKKHILDSEGNLIVKTHGFAATSTRLMATGLFYSVDSASWLRLASYGKLMIPHILKGEFRFDKSFWCIAVSPKSPDRHTKDMHIDTVTPLVKETVEKWIDSLGLKMGAYQIVKLNGRKIEKGKEIYLDKKKELVVRTIEEGVLTSRHQRLFANMRFLQSANRALPVKHIYFAGSTSAIHPEIEFRLKRRLVSFIDVQECKSTKAMLKKYVEMKRGETECELVEKKP